MGSPNPNRLSLDTQLTDDGMPGRRVSPPSSPQDRNPNLNIASSLSSNQGGHPMMTGASSSTERGDSQLEADLDSARQMREARDSHQLSDSYSHQHQHHTHHLSHPAHHSPNLERSNPIQTTTHATPDNSTIPSRPFDINNSVDALGESSADYNYGSSPTRRNHSTPSNNAAGVSPTSMGRNQGSAMNQAALARFYQQRHARHGSNTSLDSAQHL